MNTDPADCWWGVWDWDQIGTYVYRWTQDCTFDIVPFRIIQDTSEGVRKLNICPICGKRIKII